MKLPELPLPCGVARLYLSDGFKDVWTVGLVRAIQIAAARAALDEAAKVCEAENLYRARREKCPWPGDSNPFIQGHKSVTARNLELAIRSITIEGETP